MVARRHAPCRTLVEAQGEGDVEIGIVALVDGCYVGVDYCEWYLSAVNHPYEIFSDESVAVNRPDIYSASELLIEVVEAGVVFASFLHIDGAPYELGHVGNGRVGFDRLHEHLIGDYLWTGGYHLVAILGSDGHIVGNEVDLARVEHLDSGVEARRHLQLQGHPLVGSQPLHKIVVVAHRLPSVDEIAGRAVEGYDAQGVGRRWSDAESAPAR